MAFGCFPLLAAAPPPSRLAPACANVVPDVTRACETWQMLVDPDPCRVLANFAAACRRAPKSVEGNFSKAVYRDGKRSTFHAGGARFDQASARRSPDFGIRLAPQTSFIFDQT